MKKNYIIITQLFALSLAATIKPVPQTYNKIQLAINACVNGDTVVVSPGTYYENIDFRGKNIVVTSLYYLSKNSSYISSTIIDGSQPVNPDTASCVLFHMGETSAALLQGFTLRNGTGTKWQDIHGAGKFREGGGILIELSSPTIKHNVITNNSVAGGSGLVSAGGGGIRVGDGNPTICSNLIQFNQGYYGAGIVLNYTGAKITNNIIVNNSGGQAYNAGSGIWAVDNYTAAPVLIENNTIANNSAATPLCGGLLIWGCKNFHVSNNIVYGNSPVPAQIKAISCTPTVSFNDVQGGYAGTGNINIDPQFSQNNYILQTSSPCIDAGDPATLYEDIEDLSNPGNALFPSQGLKHNDMGAYGGPCTGTFPVFGTVVKIEDQTDRQAAISIFPSPASDFIYLNAAGLDLRSAEIQLSDIHGKLILITEPLSDQQHEINIQNLEAGIYLVHIKTQEYNMTQKLVVSRN